MISYEDLLMQVYALEADLERYKRDCAAWAANYEELGKVLQAERTLQRYATNMWTSAETELAEAKVVLRQAREFISSDSLNIEWRLRKTDILKQIDAALSDKGRGK